MPVRAMDFESIASANSATRPFRYSREFCVFGSESAFFDCFRIISGIYINVHSLPPIDGLAKAVYFATCFPVIFSPNATLNSCPPRAMHYAYPCGSDQFDN